MNPADLFIVAPGVIIVATCLSILYLYRPRVDHPMRFMLVVSPVPSQYPVRGIYDLEQVAQLLEERPQKIKKLALESKMIKEQGFQFLLMKDGTSKGAVCLEEV